jgi:uncharacterized protein YbbK (DUF523 family)
MYARSFMIQHNSPSLILVSACLAGLCTRYDGKIKENKKCLERLESTCWIPVCPEQLGGLPTPRAPACLTGGDGADVLKGEAKVITANGIDVSAQFIQGANQVLNIAKSQRISKVWLKSGSPSCGIHGPLGVTAALLLANGFSLEEF